MLKHQWLHDFYYDRVYLCKRHNISRLEMANLLLMEVSELVVKFSSDDEKYGDFSQVEHMTYPVK